VKQPTVRSNQTVSRAVRGFALAAAATGMLAGCGGGSGGSSSLPAARSAGPAASTSAPARGATPSASPPAGYAQQYLSDVSGWTTAIKRAAGSGSLASAQARAAGQAAVAAARKLLSQTWPARVQGDVHTLAAAFDTINEDIVAGNAARYDNDGIRLNTDANMTRAELGLPAVR